MEGNNFNLGLLGCLECMPTLVFVFMKVVQLLADRLGKITQILSTQAARLSHQPILMTGAHGSCKEDTNFQWTTSKAPPSSTP